MKTFGEYCEANNYRKIEKLVLVPDDSGSGPNLGILHGYEGTKYGVKANVTYVGRSGYQTGYFPTNQVVTATPQNVPVDQAEKLMHYLDTPAYQKDAGEAERIAQQLTALVPNVRSKIHAQGHLF